MASVIVAIASALAFARTAPPSHPSSSSLLGHAFTETATYRVGGVDLWRSTGILQTTYGGIYAPGYLVASVTAELEHLHPDSGSVVSVERIAWTAWNDVVGNVVTRRLLVEPERGEGARCYKYVEPNPPGYVDPIVVLTNRYALTNASEALAQYRYSSGGHNATMLANWHTGVPKEVHIVAERDSQYEFNLGKAQEIDWTVFYKYEDLDCTDVATFKGLSQVCVDSFLALQYECA